jgi:DUF4097 and DUF4098 domain-containing protein YvlB
MLHRLTFLLSLMLLVLSANLFAATEERTIHKTFPLQAGGTVSLKNVNGDVTIHGWDKNEVDLKATKRGPADKLDLVEIQMDSTPQRLAVETKYPRFHNNSNVSVTYELSVPKSALLDAISNVNGGVDISEIEGRMRINTVNGSADITGSKSNIEAHTVNGNITAKWTEFPKQGEVQMQTVNGGLELHLPGSVNADIEASSLNGSIRTDYPITVESGFISRKLHGKIGAGGAAINLKTVNGTIEISRL